MLLLCEVLEQRVVSTSERVVSTDCPVCSRHRVRPSVRRWLAHPRAQSGRVTLAMLCKLADALRHEKSLGDAARCSTSGAHAVQSSKVARSHLVDAGERGIYLTGGDG